jgi:RNA polymerase-binding transcription factor DksA
MIESMQTSREKSRCINRTLPVHDRICDTCGETISAARLAAMPMARRCVTCQEGLEHRSTPA